MEPERGPEALLDLSFLSEEERCAIAAVLHRDAVLRRSEEGRVRELRRAESDPARLRILTGEWFCDVRALRHRDVTGTDIVRASIRCRRRGGAAELECGLSRDERLEEEEEEEEEEEGAREESHSGDGVPAAADPRVGADIPEGERDGPGPPGDGVDGNTSSVEEDEEESDPERSSPGRAQSPTDGSSSSASTLSSSTSGSVRSVRGAAGQARGRVQLALRYEAGAQELRVHVVRCRELAESKRQRSDPYIKTYLLPDASRRSKRKTSVRRRSRDPVFNETLKYKLRPPELRGRTLNVSVWHRDAVGRNVFVGEVEVPLGTWDWDNTRPEWFDLQPRPPIPPDILPSRGHLSLALRFIPAGSEDSGHPPTGELHIWVKAAQGLVPLHGSTVDAFVQCKEGRQRTRVVKRSLSPIFNHTMVYDGFQHRDLAQACAECTLWHRDPFAKRRLGGLRLSLGTGHSYGLPVAWMDSTAEERAVWGRLLRGRGRWVEAVLPLRTDLVPRTAP
ncbi:synaptotagmin-like protein 1 isoform X2 [Cyrtonyx montezumae]|uniref:synaptotagmin-like protein 1 isoform X2 n=1 Tax=Cyrtonyx montezumae TaxID=9017 RepID=UPI0032DA696C